MKSALLFWVIALIVSASSLGVDSLAQQTNQPSFHGSAMSADELSARETMERLDSISECRDYVKKCMMKIAAKSGRLDSIATPHDTMIVVRFKVHQDGTVSDITISGNTNSPVAPRCKEAIKDCSPFPRWPEKMRQVVGKDYWEIFYHYGFNMTPPGPA